MWYMPRQAQNHPNREELTGLCLRAFVEAGSFDLSLDQLAKKVGISKRMLVHYFGGKENLELEAMRLLEENLRAQFAPAHFPADARPAVVVKALWKRATSPESKGVLLLVMDVSRRAWSGSSRARAFYDEQQRLWVELLRKYIPDPRMVETVLQVFQGAVLAYLITGDPQPGRRVLMRTVSGMTRRRA
jgi:AcrR family transcriptional regulator